ncbi:MAG: CZB domain-containing protein [Hyphomicrobiaceae bacterium]|nr:CZB domain-containing protein [Hyphomicrobiaceae bacterium]
MNLDEAIKSHSSWKMKLSQYLKNADGSLRSTEVRADNRCALGRWLQGEGRKLAGSPEYATLVQQHAHFHQAAAHIVDMANAGKSVEGETALRSDSEFGRCSRETVSAIMAMQRKLKG